MPRIIGAERNELIIDDKISGCQIALYYRMPTTSERQAYLNAAIKRNRNKVTMHHAEARMKFGMSILTGVRDGDFMRMGEQGKPMAMSSNQTSPDYYPEWKAEIEGGCGDLVMMLAALVFDGGAEIAQADDEEPGEDIAGE